MSRGWRAVWPRRDGDTHTPVLIQTGAFECGAVALGIILAYYGHPLPLAELRRVCRVSREGSTAADMVRAARACGLEARGFRVHDLKGLSDLPTPFIAHWNLNHFVVVEQMSGEQEEGGGIVLNDPESGRRRTDWDTFARHFTGVVLTFAPGPAFQGRPRRRLSGLDDSLRPAVALIRWLAPLRKWGRLIWLAAILALSALPGLLLPLLLWQIIDALPLTRAFAPFPTILLVSALALFAALLAWARLRLLDASAARLAAAKTPAFLRRLLHLPLSFFELRHAGELARRVLLNDTLAASGMSLYAVALGGAVTVLGASALLLWADPPLALIALGWVLFGAAIAQWRAEDQALDHAAAAHVENRTASALFFGLDRLEVIKAGGGEQDFGERVSALQAKSVTLHARLAQSFDWLPSLLAGLTGIVVLLAGLLRLLDGHLSGGGLVAVFLLAGQVNGGAQRLLNLRHRLRSTAVDLQRLADIDSDITAEIQPDASDPRPASSATMADGGCTLRDVSFSYQADSPPLFDHVDLSLAPGAWTILDGEAGSGKSTLAKLLAGLVQPRAGFVETPARVALVSDGAPLFAGSVRDNITLWDDSQPDAAIRAAAVCACIDHVLAALPHGYETVLDPRRVPLSGGERQRLALARALLHPPDLLILDQATDALDAVTAAQVFDNLRRLGCTVLLISRHALPRHDGDVHLTLAAGKITAFCEGDAEKNAAPEPPAPTPDHVAALERLQARTEPAPSSSEARTAAAESMRRILGGQWQTLLWMGVAGLLGAAVAPAPYLMLRGLLDGDRVWSGLAGLAGAGLLVGILSIAYYRALAKLEFALHAGTIGGIRRRLLAAPDAALRGANPDDITATALAGDGLWLLFAVGFDLLLAAIPALAAFALALAFIHPHSAVMLLLTGLGWTLIRLTFSVRLQGEEETLARSEGALRRTTQGLTEGVATIKVAGAEARSVAHWQDAWQSQGEQASAAARTQALARGWEALLPVALVGAVLLSLPAQPFISTGAWISAVLIAIAVGGVWQQIEGGLAALWAGRQAYRQAHLLLGQGTGDARLTTPADPPLTGALDVIGVTFHYQPTAPPVLDDLSFSVAPGEWVAVVGLSGAGKTTLLRLLLGFEQPQGGVIRWDGRELAEWNLPALRRRIGFVDQHPNLRANSLYQAVAGERTLSAQEVWQAVNRAGLGEAVGRLPMGLKSPIGESSLTLTDDQRRQLALARALAGKPSVLLLDEVTSGLEPAIQQTIGNVLASLSITRIVISHAAESAGRADRIVRLEGGRIVDEPNRINKKMKD